MSVKRVVALVRETVLHSRFACVWCSLRKRIDLMTADVGQRVKTSLIQNLGTLTSIDLISFALCANYQPTTDIGSLENALARLDNAHPSSTQ